MSRVLPYNAKQWEIPLLMDGRKTVTRRLVKNCNIRENQEINKNLQGQFKVYDVTPRCGIQKGIVFKPPYQPEDTMYVQETWFYECHMEDTTAGKPDLPSGRYSHRYIYKADNPDYPVNIGVGATVWCPSIRMPKEAARIWLKCTGVRVEKLQEISIDDIGKEGFSRGHGINETWYDRGRKDFADFWDSAHKKSGLDRYGWDASPWVWVIGFERCEKPNSIL